MKERSCGSSKLNRKVENRQVLELIRREWAGIRGIVVHAISDEARRFYIALGFDPCPRDSMTLVVTLADIQAAINAST